MNLTKYSNLYAYFITHKRSRGNETVLKYCRNTKQYLVVKFINFTVKDIFNTNSAFLAKEMFRRWV